MKGLTCVLHDCDELIFDAFACRHEQEKSQGSSENGELKRRVKQLEEENEEMSDNRLQLIGNESFYRRGGRFE